VIDAIEVALRGKKALPKRPVRTGAKNAKIAAELDNGIRIERTISADGKASLRLLSEDGAAYSSPQRMLDALVGELSFDPLEFARLDGKARVRALREVAKLDFEELNRERENAYYARTAVNRETKRLESQAQRIERPKGKAPERVSVREIVDELAQSQSDHTEATQAEGKAANARDLLDQIRKQADCLTIEIADKQAELEKLKIRVAKGEKATHELEQAAEEARANLPDLAEIRSRLEAAEETNRAADEAERWEAASKQAKASQKAADDLTARIDAIDREKEQAIADAKLPIDGLSWTDEGVIFRGLPFEQASSAEQLRASVAIALAMNPTLPVLLVRDGSLLDEEGLAILAEMAAESGAQIWIERVGKKGDVGIVIEDGEIVE
jgi:hypothetical protein